MRYAEHPPPSALADHVRCVWTLSADAVPEGAAPEPVIPDGCAEIVLNVGDPFAHVTGTAEVLQPRALVIGQITGPLLLRPAGRTRLVGIRLLPWAGSALLHASMAELRDTWVDAHAVLPALLELRDRLADTHEDVRAAATFAFLHARLRPARVDPLARAIVEGIWTLKGASAPAPETVSSPEEAASVGSLARSLFVSRRTVQRVLRDRVGLGPRALGRILRVQRAIARLRAAPEPVLGRVALESGYYDHAHFCREFRRMTSLSPSEFLSRERALTEVFLEGGAGSSG